MKRPLVSVRYAVLFAALVFVFSLGCLSCDELLREKGVYLASLKDEAAALERQCDDLELAIAAETSPEKLAAAAEDMGMVLAQGDDREFLVVDEGDGVPSPEVEEETLWDVLAEVLRRN